MNCVAQQDRANLAKRKRQNEKSETKMRAPINQSWQKQRKTSTELWDSLARLHDQKEVTAAVYHFRKDIQLRRQSSEIYLWKKRKLSRWISHAYSYAQHVVMYTDEIPVQS